MRRSSIVFVIFALLFQGVMPAFAFDVSGINLIKTDARTFFGDQLAISMDFTNGLPGPNPATTWACAKLNDETPVRNQITPAETNFPLWQNYQDQSPTWQDGDIAGEVQAGARCWHSSKRVDYLTFIFDQALLPLEVNTYEIYLVGCEGLQICSLPVATTISNVVSGTVARAEITASLVSWSLDPVDAIRGYVDVGGTYGWRVTKTPVELSSWCVYVDGTPILDSQLTQTENPDWNLGNKTWVNGCTTVPLQSSQGDWNHKVVGVFDKIDAFTLTPGDHSIRETATTSAGVTSEQTRVVSIPTFGTTISLLSAEQGPTNSMAQAQLRWQTGSTGVNAKWKINSAVVIQKTYNPDSRTVQVTLPKSALVEGSNAISLELSNGVTSTNSDTSLDIDLRTPRFDVSRLIGREFQPGSKVSLSIPLVTTDYAPTKVSLRTQEFGKPWSPWATVNLSQGNLNTRITLNKNTTFQIRAISTWSGTATTQTFRISVKAPSFKSSTSVVRSKINGFLSGAYITYNTSVGSGLSGSCQVEVATAQSFNFAGVYAGPNSVSAKLSIKHGKGTVTLKVPRNGVYNGFINCGIPGYADSTSEKVFKLPYSG